jgi:hypothetical protein
MRALGAGGLIFDWLRILYQEMSYVVRHENEMATEAFDSLMGILAGDSSSPILWTIYLSDLVKIQMTSNCMAPRCRTWSRPTTSF